MTVQPPRPEQPPPRFFDDLPNHKPFTPALGTILSQGNQLPAGELAKAFSRQMRGRARLGDILRTDATLSERKLLNALAEQLGLVRVDLSSLPPDPALSHLLRQEFCLRNRVLPWRRHLGEVLVATSDPQAAQGAAPLLHSLFGRYRLVLCADHDFDCALARLASDSLSDRANLRCPANFSCRSWIRPVKRPVFIACLALLGGVITQFPGFFMWLAFLWTLTTLWATSGMRLFALSSQLHQYWKSRQHPEEPPPPARLPVMSILVPLYREERILPLLLERLNRTDYPKELLDICLVLENGDSMTREALKKIDLPQWYRVIIVPDSGLKTKPRAMNYALDFCKGSVVGIYDAEDDPEPDQLHRIAEGFRASGPDVACIQGYLDFYNPRENWISRCFTIEYAAWFRVVLHGMERMRLPVPLGGTSVFFRRDALESMGAWDAHNVTEDADLGFRLARLGYRCIYLSTTTREEANCLPLRWIRQRSRWLKGYAVTWITHMRTPVQLWRDLGAKKFLAMQVLLLGTLSSFLFAPAIWSLWLLSWGLKLPFSDLLPDMAWMVLGTSFVASELIAMIVGFYAVSAREHRHPLPWVPTMMFYWPLGVAAVYKAMWELLFAPSYWDKTEHGKHTAPAPQPIVAASNEATSY